MTGSKRWGYARAGAAALLMLVGCDVSDGGVEPSVWGCDPSMESCGGADGDTDTAPASGDSDDRNDAPACADGSCDDSGGQPSGDSGDVPRPEPDGDDGADVSDDCDSIYETCMEAGLDRQTCVQQRELCKGPGDDGGSSGGGMCAASELGDEDGNDSPESGIFRCFDGMDGDCDGATDCEDEDCAQWCEHDGGDGDGDGGGDGQDHCYQTPEVACFGCSCVPGTERDCHVPGPCSWGKSTCDNDGTWGPCVETDDIPPECADGFGYDAACCVEAGRCCENLDYDYTLYDETAGAHASVGSCEAVCDPNGSTIPAG